MEMKKIVLVDPQWRRNRMPVLALPLLGAILKNQGYQVEIITGREKDLPWQTLREADLVGISTLTHTSYEAYRLAAKVKKMGIPVVLGGVHATFLPEEALQYADYVVRGEAEYSLPALVEAIRQDRLPEDIPGVSYWHNKEMRHNEDNTVLADLNHLPSPDFSLITSIPIDKTNQFPIMTTRGCPHNCIFCSVAAMFGNRCRYMDNEKVLQEISLYKDYGVWFADDNFAGNKKRTKELLQEMIDRKVCPKLIRVTPRAEIAWDDELLELMRRSNVIQLLVGFESINPEMLKTYNKKQSVEDIKESIRRFHYYGFSIMGLFIFGGDADTVETFDETLDFILETKIDSIGISILTPYVGTALYDQFEAEGRLLTKNWEMYDRKHVVFQPKNMTPEQLREGSIKVEERFYANPPSL